MMIWRLRIPTLLAAFCVSTSAFAQENTTSLTRGERNRPPTIGVGVICDTPEQISRLVALGAGGTPAERAILAVFVKSEEV